MEKDKATESVRPSRTRTKSSYGKYVDETKVAPVLSLNDRGVIKDATKTVEALFGVVYRDLAGKHVSLLFPQLMDVELVLGGNINPLLSHLSRRGHLYIAKKHKGDDFLCHVNFIQVEFFGIRSLRVMIEPTEAAWT